MSMQKVAAGILRLCDLHTPNLESAVKSLETILEDILHGSTELSCVPLVLYTSAQERFTVPENIYISVSRGVLYAFTKRSDGMSLIASSRDQKSVPLPDQEQYLEREMNFSALPEQENDIREALNAVKLARNYSRHKDDAVFVNKIKTKSLEK